MQNRSLAEPAAVSSYARLGLTLGALSALGPLAIDLYLPAFPTMVQELSATPGEVQRTLSVFFLALALAQVPIGVFSDRHGRKAALYGGLGLFVLASLACAAAPDVQSLQWLRFIQGFAICAGTVVSRAMIRDLASGHEAARLMAVSFIIIGISPVLAPLAGSLLLALMSWRELFVLLALAGLLGLALVRFELQESLPPARRMDPTARLLPVFGRLLSNPGFLTAALTAGCAMTVPYAYVTAAPFVFTGHFGIDANAYTVLLGVSAFCSIASTQAAPLLMRRWGARRLIRRAGLIGVGLCALMASAFLADGLGIVPFQLLSMALFALVGLMLTPAAISALDAAEAGAGAAASLLGTCQLAVTAMASAAISLFPAFSVLPLLAILAGSFVLVLSLGAILRALDSRRQG